MTKAIFVTLVVGFSCFGDDATDSDVEVLIVDGDRRFSVKEVTGVRYSDVRDQINQLESRFGKSDIHTRDSALPATRRWKSDGKGTLLDLYHHMLSGTVEMYVGNKVYEDFVEAFPGTTKNPRLHFDRADKYLAELAHDEEKFRAAVQLFLEGNQSRADCVRMLSSAFPSWDMPDVMVGLMAEGRTARLLTIGALPRLVDDTPVPWMRWNLNSAMLRYLLQLEFDRDPAQYKQIAARAMEYRNYFVVSGAHDVGREQLRQLLAVFMGADGRVASGGVAKANAVLRELGSDASIEVWRGTPKRIRSDWGLMEDLVPGNPTTCRASSPSIRGVRTLVTFQTTFDTGSTDDDTSPGGTVFNRGREHIFTPIIKRHLSTIKTPSYIKLADVEKIVSRLGGIRPEVQFMGNTLPVLVDGE